MLPVSGALQLKTSGARCERPMISHKGAYSRLVEAAGLGGGQKQVPQSGGARQRLQLLDDRGHGPGAEPFGFLIKAALVRIDVRGHELAQAGGQILASRTLTQVHVGLPFRRRRAHDAALACFLALALSAASTKPVTAAM